MSHMRSKVAGLFVCFFFQAAASIVEFLVHFKVIFVRFSYLWKYENEVEVIFSYILLNDRKKSYMVSMCILQKLEMTQTVITNFTLMDEITTPYISQAHYIWV